MSDHNTSNLSNSSTPSRGYAEANILYELLVHCEWPLEQQSVECGGRVSLGGNLLYRTLTQTPGNLLNLAAALVNNLRNQGVISPDLAALVGGGADWKLGVGAQGAVVAVVQPASLEIRSKKDDFASIVGKNTNLYLDPYPSWRLVSWSLDCSMVAVAYSSGTVEIFNILGASLFTIYPPKYREGVVQVDTSNALAALIFSDVRTQKIKWAAELILIDYHGNVRSYFVSPTEGYQESHVFSFANMYPEGITAAMSTADGLLIVAGMCSYMEDQTLKNNGLGHGLTVWRLINHYPHYKNVPTIDEEEYIPISKGIMSRIPGFQRSTPRPDCIFRLCISPSGRQMAALHVSGSLSIWDVPSLRKRKFWLLTDQPDREAINPSTLEYVPGRRSQVVQYSGPLQWHPADIRWWSEAAVILGRFSGAVTVSSVNSLRNLLGESPEFFEGVPQLSEGHDRGFLGLEVESRVASTRHNFSTSSETAVDEDDDDYMDSDDEEDISVYQRSKRLAKSVMYWVTDSERFRPPSKRPKLFSKTFRLLCLKSTTPEELYSRKIDNEEYGEALALARSYSLDCDRVYQQQWRRSPVTVASIQDYLSKIVKRSWVLNECLTRVPENIDAARELLMYGLRGTDLEAIIAIGSGEDQGEFMACEPMAAFDEGLDISMQEAQVKIQELEAKELKHRRQLLAKIDFKNLTGEQKNIVVARQKILVYLDRLTTYEYLLGGPHIAPEHYDYAFYDKFRSQSAILAAVEFAHNYDWRGVEAMFTHHGSETLPHRLAVLSSFPPTMGPFEYRSLLPECDDEGEVFLWETETLRDYDWCEEEKCVEALNNSEADSAEFLFKENPEMQEFCEEELSGEMVSRWYQERARQIERCCHFVDAALDLLKLGRERGVQGLEELHDSLDTLEVLVYEAGITNMTLDKFTNLSGMKKIQLLMSTSTSETYIQNVRRWLLPFLARCEKWNPGCTELLIREYVVDTAKKDLDLPLKILQHSRMDQQAPIITSPEGVITLALDCIYACQKENQHMRAFAILECLPDRSSAGANESLMKLQDSVDELEAHLTACEVLSSNSVCVTPCQLRELQADQQQVHALFTKLTRAAARRDPRHSDEDWRKLLSDMLDLQQKVFTCVEPQVCFETLTEALLSSGLSENIKFAEELLETRIDHSPIHNPYMQKVPYTQSVQLVVKAATQYFNSSESYTDDAMELAKQSLRLIESEHEDIKREKDLINAIQILPDFGINKLPLQVRLCEDKFNLIQECLTTQKGSYRHGSRLLQLSSLLRVCEGDSEAREAAVLTAVGKAALKAGDLSVASSICDQLVAGDHKSGWVVCQQLGQRQEYKNLAARARYLNFALTYATASHLEDLLHARNEVELAMLYAKVATQMDRDDVSNDSDDGFEDAQSILQATDDFYEAGENECDDHEVVYNQSISQPRLLAGTLGMTKSVLTATANTTTNLVSAVANKHFWKNAVSWLQPLHDISVRSEADLGEAETNTDFEVQGCHAFYCDLCPEGHVSSIDVSYKSYAKPNISNPSLEFSLALLRIALIEETLTHGNTVKTNTKVVQEVAGAVLKDDVTLGLSILLMLQNSKDAQAVLMNLPSTDITLQISQYYYALQIYTALHPWNGPSIPPVFLHNPGEVVAAVTMVIKKLDMSSLNEEVTSWVEMFNSTQELVEDFVQGQALQRLGAGVDIDRFLQDMSYKVDTVLGLAMTLNDEVLNLAITLAKKYQVSLWNVYMTHLQHVFDSELPTTELEKHVLDKGMMKVLLQQSEEFVRRMDQSVFLTVNGCDHDRLLFYFSLIEQCKGVKESKDAATHIKLLKKLKGSAAGLNYKLLLKPNSDILALLQPVLTANNVNNLAKMVQDVPNHEGSAVEPSTVYCAWAQKFYFQVASEKKPKTSSDWVHRYEGCGDYVQKMNTDDMVKFLKLVVLSEQGMSKIPLEARREITRRATKQCRQQQGRLKDENKAECEAWKDVAVTMECWSGHLNMLNSDNFLALQGHSDITLREYARRFAMSGGEEQVLRCLACSVLLEGRGLAELQEVISIYPESSITTPEDVIMDVLRQLLAHWAGQNTEVNVVEEGRDLIATLGHVLAIVQQYLEDGGDMLSEEEVIDEVRSLCQDESIELSTRVAVLSAAENHLALNEEDLKLVQLMRTGHLVNEAWPDTCMELDPEKLANEANRRTLLDELRGLTKTPEQVEGLLTLLKLWPAFNPEVYRDPENNPWLQTFTVAINVCKCDPCVIWPAIKTAVQDNQLCGASLSNLVTQLLAEQATYGLRWGIKAALLIEDSEVQALAVAEIQKLKSVSAADYDEVTLESIIQASLTPCVLVTPLYGPLVAHLMEKSDRDLLQAAVKQLQDAGHHHQAAALTSSNTTLPPALRNISNVIRNFTKLL
ncbi:unnamed protein product [Meganyctiphanes norvegica]|uniref:Neuroblastoma-amplified sequence n=1 Tax=Meganyctiphanes norvegica TaxID=48144 RepID=A0AAV2S4T2_MEGNR